MVKIITNNVPRPIIYGFELSEKEKLEFKYLDWSENGTGYDSTFVRYRGLLYDVGEFMRISSGFGSEFSKWDGYESDSFFSGVLIRYASENNIIDSEHVIMGLYLS